jgi:uncharacterized membrane protein
MGAVVGAATGAPIAGPGSGFTGTVLRVGGRYKKEDKKNYNINR